MEPSDLDNLDIESYPAYKKLEEVLKEYREYIQKWNDNPMHWTNNKRKMHGYPTLRGSANRKDRFDPHGRKYISIKQRVFQAVYELIEQANEDVINNMLSGLPETRRVDFWERFHGRRAATRGCFA